MKERRTIPSTSQQKKRGVQGAFEDGWFAGVAEMLKVKDVDEYLCNVLSSCYMIAHDLAHGQ